MQIQSTLKTRPQAPTSKAPVLWANGKRGEAIAEKEGLDKLEVTMKGLGVGAAANLAAAAYPSTWMHEMGHAKTIELMYDGVKPEVEVFPFKGGVTRWRVGPLSETGQKFGENGARAMVSAAGTLVDMGVAATTFGAGFKLRKKSPILGTALMGYGAMTVVNSIAYAATAVGGDLAKLAREGNDFAGLAVRTGLHPLASIAIMAAILPLEYAALSYLEKHGV
jgi:hypothetical protein